MRGRGFLAPCDLGRFRKALGEEGVEELLVRTMEVAKVEGIELKQTYAKECQLLGASP